MRKLIAQNCTLKDLNIQKIVFRLFSWTNYQQKNYKTYNGASPVAAL